MRIFLGNNSKEGEFSPYIDTFLLEGASTPLGGVLVVPGGGYVLRGDYEGDAVAKRFNELGFHAFVLQYRVAPERYPAPQCDLVRALKVIASRAQEWKMDKLAVLGFSAGGHLAASGVMLAGEFDRPCGDEADDFPAAADALILCYPVISLTDDFAHKGSGENLFGPGVSDAEKSRLDMQKLVTASTPPAFLWHTADDDTVSVRNSVEFAQKMWQCGNSCELHVFPKGFHGRGLAYSHADLRQWSSLAAKFLETSAKFTRG